MDLSEKQFVWSKALYCNYDVGTLGIIITTKQTNEGSPYIRLRFLILIKQRQTKVSNMHQGRFLNTTVYFSATGVKMW